ncbi:MAG: saccharopine dehydrogenase [Flavobacterium sp. BFFFF2]|nr:MAG: saccharopine dehydrogenase [Flavobacterium sp. BFFFF2]
MRSILLIGAGRSASSLIRYLLEQSTQQHIHLRIADLSLELATQKCAGHPNATPLALDIHNQTQRQTEISRADLIISMLPAFMHLEVAQDCVTFGKHLVTASYVSDGMQALDAAVREKGLVFMNEIGLDPGIDHMSAMQILDELRAQGAHIHHFESYCGGLIAPESDTNAWHYKFTWAPRNVILAGQGGVAKFRQNGQYKYIPYSQLFKRTDALHIENWGDFEAYANRDSMKYESLYNLNGIDTLYRGTIRRMGYSAAWDQLVTLGLTDDSYVLPHTDKLTYRDFLAAFLPETQGQSVEQKVQSFFNISDNDVAWKKWQDMGLFRTDVKFTLASASPAQLLEEVLGNAWKLEAGDKDMIVMYHRFGYELNGKTYQKDSTLVCLGDDPTFTGMAKTVGLPVGMAALRILNGQITTPGVQIPVKPEVYEPILVELQQYGIHFTETTTEV